MSDSVLIMLLLIYILYAFVQKFDLIIDSFQQ